MTAMMTTMSPAKYWAAACCIVLAAALCGASAHAEKLGEQQIQSLLDHSDKRCHETVPTLPGDTDSYNVDAICACSRKLEADGLRSLDFGNPQSFSAADQKKVDDNTTRAGITCVQPYYVTAISKSTSKECFAALRGNPAAQSESDDALHKLCDCTGNKFALSNDPETNLSLSPEARQRRHDELLSRAVQSCMAERKQH
jgi:hypothetical protein